ncbi:MAG: hypothetical protein RJA81_770 [Planctomycetota bacterium]
MLNYQIKYPIEPEPEKEIYRKYKNLFLSNHVFF